MSGEAIYFSCPGLGVADGTYYGFPTHAEAERFARTYCGVGEEPVYGEPAALELSGIRAAIAIADQGFGFAAPAPYPTEEDRK